MVESVAEEPWKIAMQYSLTEGQLYSPADAGVVEGLSARLGVTLPQDYICFLKEHNGGEGFIGNNYVEKGTDLFFVL